MMNPNNSVRLALVLLAIVVGGCASIAEKRKIDYGAVKSLPPLDVPPDLSAPSGDKSASPAAATFSEFTSGQNKQGAAPGAPAKVLPEYSNIRIERDGQVRWIVAHGRPEQLWPQVRAFVLSNGLVVARENPQTGVIETEWAENRAKVGTGSQKLLAKALGTLYSTGTRDRFRLRLDRGTAPDSVEIYITHQGMEEVVSRAGGDGNVEETRWQPRASDPDLEIEMMRLLMAHLGTGGDRTAVAAAPPEAAPKAEPTPAAPERAKLVRNEGSAPFLSLQESLDRAWRRVGLTLDRVGFTIDDRDRSQWTYYIRYVDPDKKSKKASDDEYRIHLKESGAETVIEVLDKEGVQLASKPGDRILGLLHESLNR